MFLRLPLCLLIIFPLARPFEEVTLCGDLASEKVPSFSPTYLIAISGEPLCSMVSSRQTFHLFPKNETEFFRAFTILSQGLEEIQGRKYRSWEPSVLIHFNQSDVMAMLNVTVTLGLTSQIYLHSGKRIFEIYGINEEEPLILNEILGREKEKWVERRTDFRGVMLRASSARDPSSKLHPRKGERGLVKDPLEILEDGTPTMIFSELKQALNFRAKLKKGDWISHKNWTLKGITVDAFRKKRIDIFLGMSSLLPYRATELTFLQPVYSDGVNAFFIQPESSSLRDLVLQTFSYTVWLALLITYFLIIISIKLVAMKLRKFSTELSSSFDKEPHLLWAIGSLCQQGWYHRPRSDPLRILFILGYFLGLIIYVAFAAAVVSLLSVNILPIQSGEDLLDSALSIYADGKSSTMAYIILDLKSRRRNLRVGSLVGVEGGVEKLRSLGPTAFLAFPHYFYLIAKNLSLTEEWVCRHLSTVPVTLSPTPHAMLVNKNSPFYHQFNFILVKRMERGLNHRFVTLFEEVTTTRCPDASGMGQPPSIAFGDVFTSYVILCSGTVLSFLILLMEKFAIRPQLGMGVGSVHQNMVDIGS